MLPEDDRVIETCKILDYWRLYMCICWWIGYLKFFFFFSFFFLFFFFFSYKREERLLISEMFTVKFHSDQVVREVLLSDQGTDGEFDSKQYIHWYRLGKAWSYEKWIMQLE